MEEKTVSRLSEVPGEGGEGLAQHSCGVSSLYAVEKWPGLDLCCKQCHLYVVVAMSE